MRKMINLWVIAAVVCLFASLTAFAKDKSETITFSQDVTINGTLVKKGEYKVRFDEKSGELLLMKGKTIVAKSPARLEKREGKAARSTEFNTVSNGSSSELREITFRGDNQKVVLGQGSASNQATTAQ